MSDFVKVAKAGDIPTDTARCVEARGKRIALYNLDGEFYATQENCTHAEASLCEGDVVGDEIMCPLHFAMFNIRTGECTGPPADEDLETYEVRVNGDDIEIKV